MSSVHQFISQIRDQQTSARYEPKVGGKNLANMIATVQGSSLLTASGDCVIQDVFALLAGSSVLSLGQMAPSERNRSGKDHNLCIFAPAKDGEAKGAITTIGYGQPTPDDQYTEQVKAFEADDTVQAVCMFAGHFTKGSKLGVEWQIQYRMEDGVALIQLLAW
jgi:hypothetical protein